MNDRAVSLLDQYEVEVLSTKKGRDAILCETDRGCLILKEYRGQKERLDLQNKLLFHMKEQGFIQAEEILPTKEGILFVKDRDGVDYILKTYVDGRECDIQSKEELVEAVSILGRMQEAMKMPVEEQDISKAQAYSPRKEYEKKDRELGHVRKYLRGKGQKNEFERQLLNCYDYFLEEAREISNKRILLEEELTKQSETLLALPYCHGDYQYHNILNKDGEWFIINFEKYVIDSPIRDLYLLLRKLLEKNDWSMELGVTILQAYEKEHSFTEIDRKDLYYRLAYPEKFRKIVNYYYNTSKAWIPGKNIEKLVKVLEQEPKKQAFLKEAFGNLF